MPVSGGAPRDPHDPLLGAAWRQALLAGAPQVAAAARAQAPQAPARRRRAPRGSRRSVQPAAAGAARAFATSSRKQSGLAQPCVPDQPWLACARLQMGGGHPTPHNRAPPAPGHHGADWHLLPPWRCLLCGRVAAGLRTTRCPTHLSAGPPEFDCAGSVTPVSMQQQRAAPAQVVGLVVTKRVRLPQHAQLSTAVYVHVRVAHPQLEPRCRCRCRCSRQAGTG
jgi:hypothetical protein